MAPSKCGSDGWMFDPFVLCPARRLLDPHRLPRRPGRAGSIPAAYAAKGRVIGEDAGDYPPVDREEHKSSWGGWDTRCVDDRPSLAREYRLQGGRVGRLGQVV